jgi:hypothetical protein
LATYQRDFDFTLHNSGTVFRLHQRNNKGQNAYSWYVIVRQEEHSLEVYSPIQNGPITGNDYYLQLRPDFEVSRRSIKQTAFMIEDALYALWPEYYPTPELAKKVTPGYENDALHSVEIDIIHGGLPEKVKEAVKATQTRSLLVPSPNPAL